MVSPHEPFILHPSVLSTALQPDRPYHVHANHLFGELTMRRYSGAVVGDLQWVEVQALDGILASPALRELDQANVESLVSDATTLLYNADLFGGLAVFDPAQYLTAAVYVALRYNLLTYDAMMVAAAGARDMPLVVDDEALHDRLRIVAAAQPQFRVVRLRDYVQPL